MAVQIRRIEGERRRMLTYTWIIAAAGSMMNYILPFFFMEVAAFRTEDPQFIQRFNDLGWLCFLAGPYIFSIQALILATAVLQDRRENPVFPRWSGFLGLWCGLLFLPGTFIVFFKTGPIAWNGLLSWWIPFVAFGVWIVTVAILVIRAARTQQPDPVATADVDLAAQVAELAARVERLVTPGVAE
ncbi:hypothetical protein ACW2Q0_29875 [Nocardia sp. R16R-3T]